MNCPIHKDELKHLFINRQGFLCGYCEDCHSRWILIGNTYIKEEDYLNKLPLILEILKIGNPSVKQKRKKHD